MYPAYILRLANETPYGWRWLVRGFGCPESSWILTLEVWAGIWFCLQTTMAIQVLTEGGRGLPLASSNRGGDVSKHSSMHSHLCNHYPAPDVNSTETETPWCSSEIGYLWETAKWIKEIKKNNAVESARGRWITLARVVRKGISEETIFKLTAAVQPLQMTK